MADCLRFRGMSAVDRRPDHVKHREMPRYLCARVRKLSEKCLGRRTTLNFFSTPLRHFLPDEHRRNAIGMEKVEVRDDHAYGRNRTMDRN